VIKQTIDLPADLMSRLTRAAQLTGVPEAEIVRTALQDWLAQQPPFREPPGSAAVAPPIPASRPTEMPPT
jgi:Ribbon-helix-helix protein, copG family